MKYFPYFIGYLLFWFGLRILGILPPDMSMEQTIVGSLFVSGGLFTIAGYWNE